MIEPSFFTPTVCFQACCKEKPVGRNAQCGVMMETAPPAALIMEETELLFQLLIIPLDAPAHHRRTHQGPKRRRDREASEPIMDGLGFLSGPVDQRPLLLAGSTPMPVPVRRAEKREESLASVPDRHVTVRQARAGS